MHKQKMKAYLLPRESAWNLCSIKNKNKDSLGLGSDSGHVALIAKHKTLDTRNGRLGNYSHLEEDHAAISVEDYVGACRIKKAITISTRLFYVIACVVI